MGSSLRPQHSESRALVLRRPIDVLLLTIVLTAIWGVRVAVAGDRMTAAAAQHDEQQHETCSTTSTPSPSTTIGKFALPEAAEESVRRVQEVLHPISLQMFAEEYWERKPLVIRGR